MANYPPFMNAYGQIEKILNKIKTAQTPPRFTQDFLETKLGFSGGSARAFIPLAKRLGLIGSDGVPTDLYHRFRNSSSSKQAMAEALRKGYSDLYTRNEYAHDLDESDVRGLVIEATGLDEDAPTLRSITKSFLELKKFADFEVSDDLAAGDGELISDADFQPANQAKSLQETQPVGIGMSYTINLNLPETKDIAVFNAIFKSLKDNLLRRS